MKHFKNKKAYQKFTDYVKIHHLSKRKRSHTVLIHGKKHRVKHKENKRR